jgi:hypothetical protein
MKNTPTSFALSVITLTLLLTACSGANSGPSTPEANNGASTANTTASTGSTSPSLPVTTPGPELPAPTPATPSQPVNPAAAAIAALEANGTIPKLDRSESLAGPDLDGNGVRDDVDAWIKSKLTDPKQIAAAVQFAKVMQQAILVDASNNSGTRIVGKNMSIAISCVFSRFPYEGSNSSFQIVKKIEALTSNTKYRLKAYLAYNRSRDGTTSSSPIGETCE